jgi:hypothetical protein
MPWLENIGHFRPKLIENNGVFRLTLYDTSSRLTSRTNKKANTWTNRKANTWRQNSLEKLL